MNDEFWGEFVAVIIVIIVGVFIYQHFVHQPFEEVSGIVKYDDCREKITLSPTEDKTGTYVCDDLKTKSGKSMGGECVKIKFDGGQCQTAYVYKKPAEATCGSNSYLGSDDLCYCGYGYTMREGSCVSYTQSCQWSFGVNSYGTSDNMCYCNAGYFWSSDKTFCVSWGEVNQICAKELGVGSYYSGTIENGKYQCNRP